MIFVNTGAGRLPRCAAGDGTRFRPVADSTRGRVAVRAIGSAVGLSLRVTTATGPRSGIPCLCPVGLTGAGTNLSDPSGLCTARFNIQQFYALPTLYLCILCGSENKQLFFFYIPRSVSVSFMQSLQSFTCLITTFRSCVSQPVIFCRTARWQLLVYPKHVAADIYFLNIYCVD